MKSNQKGFTLIELLVVIAIIGILASIVLASLNTARTSSRDARRVADLNSVRLALELYFDSASSYPTSTTWAELDTALEGAGVIASVPVDPLDASPQVYDYDATGTNPTSYVLSVTLEDAGHNAYDSDVDGTVVGVNCDDPLYCIAP